MIKVILSIGVTPLFLLMRLASCKMLKLRSSSPLGTTARVPRMAAGFCQTTMSPLGPIPYAPVSITGLSIGAVSSAHCVTVKPAGNVLSAMIRTLRPNRLMLLLMGISFATPVSRCGWYQLWLDQNVRTGNFADLVIFTIDQSIFSSINSHAADNRRNDCSINPVAFGLNLAPSICITSNLGNVSLLDSIQGFANRNNTVSQALVDRILHQTEQCNPTIFVCRNAWKREETTHDSGGKRVFQPHFAGVNGNVLGSSAITHQETFLIKGKLDTSSLCLAHVVNTQAIKQIGSSVIVHSELTVAKLIEHVVLAGSRPVVVSCCQNFCWHCFCVVKRQSCAWNQVERSAAITYQRRAKRCSICRSSRDAEQELVV